MKNHRPLQSFSLEECRPGRTHLLLAALADPAAVVPLIAIKGESAGPLFIAVAGVHGDEFEGPQAIWEIARDLPPSSLRGTLLALPVCNPWAFAAGLRSTPDAIDGRNLAREFPGAADGAPTQRLAQALLAFVLAMKPALFLDLHSGGTRYMFLPVVGYRRGLGDEARSSAAARAFGLSALWEMADHAGTFNTETARRGITTVGVEMTGAGGCRREDVAANRDGMLNLMRWLGMLQDQPAPQVPGPFRRTTDVLPPASGFIVPLRAVGDRVEAKDSIARIHSLSGDLAAEIEAPHAGQIWAMRHLRAIQEGEIVTSIAELAGAEKS
ncbi:MAG TPA: succinylglutamate desuccinylase/aspartoacylase family protein [bacterium]|nr:succinylglutamate desuccinylase/aspartoacylase family protein [bacterium]